MSRNDPKTKLDAKHCQLLYQYYVLRLMTQRERGYHGFTATGTFMIVSAKHNGCVNLRYVGPADKIKEVLEFYMYSVMVLSLGKSQFLVTL